MGWTTRLLVMSLLGLSACQQRSIAGGRRRQRVPSGKSEVANFNCPEDFGYYPHPSDCTQYYVCVFGGALQESCTGGLMYSHELQTCDWPRNVQCSLSPAGSGVSTIRVTDPRTQNTNPIRASTEALTPSVGFDGRFENSIRTSQQLRASESAFTVFDGSDKANRQSRFFRQQPDPQQSLNSPRFSQQPFFPDTAVQESSSRPINVSPTTPRPQVFPPAQTPRPQPSRSTPATPLVDDLFFGHNFTDADYFYYYDDLLYDYYDIPELATQAAPTRRPAATPAPVRIHTDSSKSKSIARGGPSRGDQSSSRSSFSHSSPLRAATSSKTSFAPRGASAIPRSRGGQTQFFEFSDFDFDAARAGSSSFSFSGVSSSPPDSSPSFSSSSSSSSSPARPSSSTSQSLRTTQRQSPQSSTRSDSQSSRSRGSPRSQPTSARPRALPHPSRIQANTPFKKTSPQRPSSQTASQRLRASSNTPRRPTASNPASRSPSSSSLPSTLSRSSSSTKSSPRQTVRQPSSNRGSSAAASSGPVSTDSSVPKRSRRPTLKPVSELAPSGPTQINDIWRYPPRRVNPLYPQPPVDTKASKCDPKVCRLPDCYCGGREVPGGLSPQQTPQIVLLTFDDAVNDLNKGLYTELFESGRKNPNGCPITSTMYVSHEWTDYGMVQNLYADGHEMASHSIQHSFGEQFSTKKWAKEIAGQREILSAYGGVKMEDVRGMRAPFLAIGGNKMFKMLYEQNFTYDSSMPVYENNPPSWPYTLDYKIFHDCMIPPCPTNSYPGVWQVPMVMWQDLNGGRCSMGDACTTPPDAEGVYKMLIKNFERHYTTNRAPFGLFYHAAWFTTPHHKEGFIAFLDTISAMDDVWLVTNWQLLQWMRDPQPLSTIKNFAPFGCSFPDRKKCASTKVCNVWHKGGVRYMRTCQRCPEKYPWTGNTGVVSPLNEP